MKFYITTVSLLFLSACAHTPKVIQGKFVKDSHISIVYDLGHSHYQFKASAKGKSAEISSWRDDKILEKKIITLDQYEKFADKAYEVVKVHGHDEILESCRTPFQISLVSKKDQTVISGCRDDKNKAMVGQLIKEGEFLLYK